MALAAFGFHIERTLPAPSEPMHGRSTIVAITVAAIAVSTVSAYPSVDDDIPSLNIAPTQAAEDWPDVRMESVGPLDALVGLDDPVERTSEPDEVTPTPVTFFQTARTSAECRYFLEQTGRACERLPQWSEKYPDLVRYRCRDEAVKLANECFSKVQYDGSVIYNWIFSFPDIATPSAPSAPASPTSTASPDRVSRQILVNGYVRSVADCAFLGNWSANECQVIPEARPDLLQTRTDCVAAVVPKVRACLATINSGGTKEILFNFRYDWESTPAIKVDANSTVTGPVGTLKFTRVMGMARNVKDCQRLWTLADNACYELPMRRTDGLNRDTVQGCRENMASSGRISAVQIRPQNKFLNHTLSSDATSLPALPKAELWVILIEESIAMGAEGSTTQAEHGERGAAERPIEESQAKVTENDLNTVLRAENPDERFKNMNEKLPAIELAECATDFTAAAWNFIRNSTAILDLSFDSEDGFITAMKQIIKDITIRIPLPCSIHPRHQIYGDILSIAFCYGRVLTHDYQDIEALFMLQCQDVPLSAAVLEATDCLWNAMVFQPNIFAIASNVKEIFIIRGGEEVFKCSRTAALEFLPEGWRNRVEPTTGFQHLCRVFFTIYEEKNSVILDGRRYHIKETISEGSGLYIVDFNDKEVVVKRRLGRFGISFTQLELSNYRDVYRHESLRDYLVPLLDVEVEDGFAMARGQNFEEEMAKMDEQTILNHFTHLLRGLKELHSIGFAHANVRPANIVLFEGKSRWIDWFALKPLAESFRRFHIGSKDLLLWPTSSKDFFEGDEKKSFIYWDLISFGYTFLLLSLSRGRRHEFGTLETRWALVEALKAEAADNNSNKAARVIYYLEQNTPPPLIGIHRKVEDILRGISIA
ncbi:hypothetical protein HDU96_010772 [Phlyctochytrium bullatum]|nr:hypothetical protein HDU96_010772 [Phlyctochytrium bullatum]